MTQNHSDMNENHLRSAKNEAKQKTVYQT